MLINGAFGVIAAVLRARAVVLLAVVFLLGGCKIIVQPEEGGVVRMENSRDICASGSCTIDIWWGGAYSETFVAEPLPGYEFTGWKKGPGLLCGGTTEPCVLNNVPGELTALNINFRLVPQFAFLGDAPVSVSAPGVRQSVTVSSTFGSAVFDRSGTYSLGTIPVGERYHFSVHNNDTRQSCRLDKPYGKVENAGPIVLQLSCDRYSAEPRPIGFFSTTVRVGETTNWSFEIADRDNSTISVGYDLVDGPDGGDLSYEVDSSGAGLSLSGSVPGDYLFIILLSDGRNLVTQEFWVRVFNEEPVVGPVRLTPVTTADPVVASFQNGPPSDPEGYDLTISYEWQINRRPIAGYNGTTLPVGVARRDDWVQAFVRVSDGGTEVLRKSNLIRVEDSPIEVSIPTLPTTVSAQGFSGLGITATDFDGPPVVELAYSPPGMRLVNEQLSWQPDIEMFDQSQVIHFGLRNADNADIVEHFSVELIDESRPPMKASSAVYTPHTNHSMWVGQFDEDEEVEVLLSDTVARVMTVEYRDGEYFQDWLHAPALATDFVVEQTLGVDLTGDGILEVVALSERQLFVIENRASEARLVYEAPAGDAMASVAVAELDNDAALELVVALEDSLRIIDSSTGELEREIPVLNRRANGSRVLIGNIDADPALEAILARGAAYDLQTGQQEWQTEFWLYNFSLVDVNDDGVKEVFALSEGRPTLYNGADGSIYWNQELTWPSGCTVAGGDLDGQPGDELLVMQCAPNGELIAYQATLDGPTEMWRVGAPGYDKAGVTLADIDGDGEDELFWASEVGTSFPDKLVVAELVEGGIERTDNDTSLQSSIYQAVGSVTPATGGQQALYLTSRVAFEHRALFIDGEGNFSASPSFGENLFRSTAAQLTDYDADGVAELVAGSTDRDEGKLVALDLESRSVETTFQWNHEREQVISLDMQDFNGDGREDAFVLLKHEPIGISTYYSFSVVDLYNGVEIGGSRFFDQLIAMAVVDLDGDGVPEVVTSSDTELRSWRWNSQEKFFERYTFGTLDFGCSAFVVGEVDGGKLEEIICQVYQEFAVSLLENPEAEIRVLNSRLQTLWTLELDYGVTALSLDATETPVRNIYLGVHPGPDCYGRQNCTAGATVRLVSLDKGHKILESPMLMGGEGVNSIHSGRSSEGRRRLFFATDRAMYQTR